MSINTTQLNKATLASARKRKQAGFTMIELIVVLAILALIILAMSGGLFQSKEDSKVQAAQMQLLKDFPSAITRAVTMANKCNDTTVSSTKLIARGAPKETVFGTTWTVTTSGNNTVTVTYPLDVEDTTHGNTLATALNEAPNVKSATGTQSQVVVSYRCN